MTEQTDVLQVNGIRCERCVNRLAVALRAEEGLVGASANMMGQVTMTWDDDVTDRETLVAALSRAGFREDSLV